ncbi:unnamed protein product [Closterium sp. Yama58-4]|nr:unnamed protein product [Closterium sp. Yama58-4]
MEAPLCAKVPFSFPPMFGDVREDPHHWLRDERRENPDVLAHLAAENALIDALLPSCGGGGGMGCVGGKGVGEGGEEGPSLRVLLEGEMKARVKQEDRSVPLSGEVCWADDNQTLFYVAQDEKDRPCSVMRHVIGTPASQDARIFFEKDEAFDVGVHRTSSDRFIIVTCGSAVTSFLLAIDVQRPLDPPWQLVPRVHNVEVYGDHSGAHFFLLRRSDQMRNSELLALPLLALPAADADATAATISPSSPTLLPLSLSSPSPSVSSPFHLSALTLLSPFSPSHSLLWHGFVKLQSVTAFKRHVVVFERVKGLQRIRCIPLQSDGSPAPEEAKLVEFNEAAYEIRALRSRFESPLLRFSFSSLVTPTTVFERDMDTGRQAARKVDWVGPSFNPSLYSSRRLFATAKDGTQVPISLVHRNTPASDSPADAAAADTDSTGPPWPMLLYAYGADGTQVPISLVYRNSTSSNSPAAAAAAAADGTGPPWPMLLYAYGAYEVPTRLSFSSDRLSLLDRGVAVAIAHVRGGGDWDYQWYLDGKLLRKRNTVWDVIACAEHLIKEGLTTPDRLALEGRSAGGIPVGAAVNERPDLFRSAVAGVPFVDVLSTMLDASLHLTITEWEFSPPHPSPVPALLPLSSPCSSSSWQVKAQGYPNILATASLHDQRVNYWEPAKWVARLRDANTSSDSVVLLRCEMDAGHFSKTGR